MGGHVREVADAMAQEVETMPEEKPKQAISLGAPSISHAIEQLSHNNNYGEMTDKQIQYQLHKGVADQVDINESFSAIAKESEIQEQQSEQGKSAISPLEEANDFNKLIDGAV